MNFRRSIITAELWRPEVPRRWKNVIFSFFFGKTTPYGKFQNSIQKGFSMTSIDLLCSNFVKFGRRKIGKLVRYLPDKNKKSKISPGSPALATERIAPKNCQCQPQTMYYSECSRFHLNRFTFGGIISERVNTVRSRSKVNPIFEWSLASSRIMKKNTNSLAISHFQLLQKVGYIETRGSRYLLLLLYDFANV